MFKKDMEISDALMKLRESARNALDQGWFITRQEKRFARLLLAQCDYIESKLPTAPWLECAAMDWQVPGSPECALVRSILKESEGL
jgi:hypothetical protein